MKNSRSPIFIVGCGRSGTTLLHSILANHSDLAAFTESNILHHCLGGLEYRRFGRQAGLSSIAKYCVNSALNQAGITVRYPSEAFLTFSRNNNVDGMAFAEKSYLLKTVFRNFTLMMETLSEGKRWVDKSPQSVFCLQYIERYIRYGIFIHVIRNNRSNIASLIDAGRKHDDFKDRFGGERAVKRATAFYNASLKASVDACVRCPSRHYIVRYEDLASHPQSTISKVSEFIELEIPDACINYNPGKVSLDHEVWKLAHSEQIKEQPSKFDSVLSSEERNYVIKAAADADWHFPRRMTER